MDQQTQITIVVFAVNIIISALVSIAVAFFRIGNYQNKVDTLETTIGRDEHNGLRKTVGELSRSVTQCETLLKEREPLGKRKSPLALTERGIRFLNESGAKKFVDDNFRDLLQQVEGMNPQTAYDVQEDSKSVIEKLRDDSRLNPLKEWLFKDGSTLDDLFFVMSIHLRDKVLENKNWNVKDIDSHAPGK